MTESAGAAAGGVTFRVVVRDKDNNGNRLKGRVGELWAIFRGDVIATALLPQPGWNDVSKAREENAEFARGDAEQYRWALYRAMGQPLYGIGDPEPDPASPRERMYRAGAVAGVEHMLPAVVEEMRAEIAEALNA